MPAPKELQKTEQAIAAFRSAPRCVDATYLALWLCYLPLAGRVGNIDLRMPLLNGTPYGTPAQLCEAFTAGEPACMEDAFAALSALCRGLEEVNEVLRDTATALLSAMPQAPDVFEHLQALLPLLAAYAEQQEDRAAAAEFLKTRLNSYSVFEADGLIASPDSVCRLFSALVPQRGTQGGTLFIPCCGTGHLAAALVQHADSRVVGQDISPTARPYFLIRNLLAGNTFARYVGGNAITQPLSRTETALQQFDTVACQPPFGFNAEGAELLENDPYRRFDRGLPRRNSGDWLHICNCLAYAEPTHGVVMTLVTRATLFRVDVARGIRRRLVEENLLDAVIELPGGMLPGTAVSTALLIFKHSRRRKGVRLISAAAMGEKARRLVVLSDRDIERIRKAYESDADEPGFARTVAPADMAAQEDTWEVCRYITPVAEADAADSPEEQQAAITRLRSELAAKQARLAELLAQLQ